MSPTAESSPADTAERPPRPAATLVVLRDAAGGIEVLLLRRAERGDHNSNAWVFPGGLVDRHDAEVAGCCAGLDDAQASAALGLDEGGLAYHVAAVRECFEECGLLYGCDEAGALLTLQGAAAERLDGWRGPLHRGERRIAELCREHGFRLAVDRLAYLSHWVTPVGRAKRFDARFFVAALPPAQTSLHDGAEMVDQAWLRPADALARKGELKLMTPTQKTLELLTRFASVADVLAYARSARAIGPTMPRLATGSKGLRPVLPDEPAYAEIGRVDPPGHGTASYELVPGRATQLSLRVHRVTADNGSFMTGPGTNAYLVGGLHRNEWAVIDPGPLDERHVQAIVDAARGPITRIFVTHTHKDHSPAAALLKSRTGATLHGLKPTHAEGQDDGFEPEVVLRGGERIELDGATLRVIHTPGHASNHLCYLLEEERLLFTGDHLMQLSTVVINPPDGDMAAYLASLRALPADEIDWLAPGHGFLMDQPRRTIDGIVAHRLKREAKVVSVLRELGGATADELLPRVYDDVPAQRHRMAARSLQAHLRKLRAEGAAVERDGRWSPV